MKPSSVVIVIPIHNDNPSYYELISFKQCFLVLGRHPIKIVAPQNLKMDKYAEVVPNLNIVFIDPKWQSSLLNYNKLKLSSFFYNFFEEFEFLLTYELDAFVFKDELNIWCTKGYDYIGAPWFENYSENGNKLVGVGNSGFSLRRIKSIKHNLTKVYYKDPLRFERGGKFKSRIHRALFPFVILISKFNRKENFTIQRAGFLYEDQVISTLFPKIDKGFKIAPIEEAAKFSFELKPETMFELNNNELPMGCHGWLKYGFQFWKPIIEALGHFYK